MFLVVGVHTVFLLSFVVGVNIQTRFCIIPCGRGAVYVVFVYIVMKSLLGGELILVILVLLSFSNIIYVI